jgi:hypothetical protein
MQHMECFAFSSGIDSRAFSQYYVAYDSKAKEVATAAKPIAGWQKAHATSAEKLKAFLATKALDESKVGFLPLLFTVHPQRRHDRRPGQRYRQNPRKCACCSISSV